MTSIPSMLLDMELKAYSKRNCLTYRRNVPTKFRFFVTRQLPVQLAPVDINSSRDKTKTLRDASMFSRHTTLVILSTSVGNDSMDTAHKIAKLANESGLDLIGIGGPKTIDNDVGDSEFKLIDHTPGYGSCAKYWMHAVQNANEENQGSCPADPVLVLQAMGRRIGFIPAAARLADPNREMPLQIYLAESPCSLEQLHHNVNEQLKSDGRCLVVLSEGFDVGDIGERKDSFGHTQFSSSQITVAQIVTNYLNDRRSGCERIGSLQCAWYGISAIAWLTPQRPI